MLPKRLLTIVLAYMSLVASAQAAVLLDKLRAEAPKASPVALQHALQARDCAVANGVARQATRLAVIDYSLPSTEPRLWVFDLVGERLIHAEHVAHGRGTGEDRAEHFSNIEGSHQSSLGLFLTAETYQGGNGYSLRLDGLEPGINDRARDRLIVMHGAPYVDPLLAKSQGRLGRSFGCPAVRPEIAQEVIDSLRDGQLLFAYYPDMDWLSTSPFQSCQSQSAALRDAAGGSDVGASY